MFIDFRERGRRWGYIYIYIYIERERERERERDRHTDTQTSMGETGIDWWPPICVRPGTEPTT